MVEKGNMVQLEMAIITYNILSIGVIAIILDIRVVDSIELYKKALK